jgi:hypothetical protein
MARLATIVLPILVGCGGAPDLEVPVELSHWGTDEAAAAFLALEGQREYRPCFLERGPCVVLSHETYYWAWGYAHQAWFLDARGRQFLFSSEDERRDVVHQFRLDVPLSRSDFARILAASRLLDERAPPDDVETAVSLISAAQNGPTTGEVSNGPDSPSGALTGYLPDPTRDGFFFAVSLQEDDGLIVTRENVTRAARAVTQWTRWLRDGPGRGLY